MAWFSGKVSLGNFPDLAGAVNKLSESVKNIEKNFDTALGFEDKSDSSSTTEASGIWPVMSFMGNKNEDSNVESSGKTVSPQTLSTAEENESQNSDTQQITSAEENQLLERENDAEHPEIAEEKDDVISDTGKAELESEIQSETKAVEPPEPVVHDVKVPDSVDVQGNEISEEGCAENLDTLEVRSEAFRVDEVEAPSIFHDESHNLSHTPDSKDEQETQDEETVEQSSTIQGEASNEAQPEALNEAPAQASTDTLAEASSDTQAEAPSDTRAEASSDTQTQAGAALDSSSSQPVSAEVNEMVHGFSLTNASPLDKASEIVSGSVSQADDDHNQTVGGDKRVNDGEIDIKDQHLSLRSNISDSIDSTAELEKVKTEMKMMETALQGAARQAQAKADDIAKLMNENENLKIVIEELKRKSNDAEIESLREEYHQRVATLERKVYALTRERDTLRREQNKKSDAAALLKEKDEIINQVMAEGEELSKKQAAQESTIRKLRAQIREFEEEKKGLMTKVQVEENKVESIKKDKTATENLLQETIEKHQAELSAQKVYYTNALSAAKEAEALAEARANNEARTELESRLREAAERETMLVQELEELRQTLSRKEQQAVFREEMLRRDIEDLQKRYQASERRCEELITQVPDSTRPLLRQIEAMQETTARRAEAWAAVERSLNSRLQEAEVKAADAEEREHSVNERLSQTLSRINVLEVQISCLRAEQTQLSRSLEKERQRAAENRQEYLAAKEEADTQEGRANQLEGQIKELRQKHKEELHDALVHQELLQQEIEREKAARLELERTAHIHSASASDKAPIARSNSAFENGNLTRKFSSASSLGSIEESYFLQASLDTSDSLSERRNPGEATMSPYYMKSMTPSAFESALRHKEGELASYMSRLASMESIRDSLAEELVKMTAQCEKLQAESALLPGVRAELDALRRRHSAALELMGERDEELEELRADIVDLKEMYREQVNLLVNKIQILSTSSGNA
ncbi:GOLGIN CANDIDATE 5 [Salix viminalis]|uniref:GOLGIN CANDIDATE 5 n=1 Tax=Salix viminalis TaxID=40686 RepID=A0A9Q0T884_SALVM|nr:GOLGIN CANDIDATE 5 [Salix viminalis]